MSSKPITPVQGCIAVPMTAQVDCPHCKASLQVPVVMTVRLDTLAGIVTQAPPLLATTAKSPPAATVRDEVPRKQEAKIQATPSMPPMPPTHKPSTKPQQWPSKSMPTRPRDLVLEKAQAAQAAFARLPAPRTPPRDGRDRKALAAPPLNLKAPSSSLAAAPKAKAKAEPMRRKRRRHVDDNEQTTLPMFQRRPPMQPPPQHLLLQAKAKRHCGARSEEQPLDDEDDRSDEQPLAPFENEAEEEEEEEEEEARSDDPPLAPLEDEEAEEEEGGIE
jgi:hypothetical protein